MELSKRVDQTVSQWVAPQLRLFGFKKNGRTFWRGLAPVTDVITVQKASHNTCEKADFTINLGSYWHGIQEDIGRSYSRWPPKEHDCTIFTRLGFLFNSNCDFWWRMDNIQDDEAVGKDVSNKIIAYGIPWLDECHDIKIVLTRAQKHFYRLQMDKVEELIKQKYGID